MERKNSAGVHLDVKIIGANHELLNNLEFIKDTLKEVAKHYRLTPLHEGFYHRFSPNSLMGIIPLKESHIVAYLHPKDGEAEMCVQTCTDGISISDLESLLKKKLRAQSVNIRDLRREYV